MLVQTLTEIDPQFPTVSQEAREALLVSKEGLESEAHEGVAADPIADKIAAAAEAKE